MKHYALLISFLALSACSQGSEDLNEWMAQTRREAKAEIIPFQAPTLPVAPVYSPPQLSRAERIRLPPHGNRQKRGKCPRHQAY